MGEALRTYGDWEAHFERLCETDPGLAASEARVFCREEIFAPGMFVDDGRALRLLSLLERLWAYEEPGGFAIQRVLQKSLAVAVNRSDANPLAIQAHAMDLRNAHEFHLPIYPFDTPALDAKVRGAHGITTISGDTGVGKSSLLLRTLLYAAKKKLATTIYLNGELDVPTVADMTARILRVPQEIYDLAVKPRFHHLQVLVGLEMEAMCAQAIALIDRDTERVLIGLDSMNVLARKFAGDTKGMSYFRNMETLYSWALGARMEAPERISFVLTSEMNQRGDTTGLTLNYVSDCVLHLKDSGESGYVDVKVRKGRYSGRCDVGTLWNNWRYCRMEGQRE